MLRDLIRPLPILAAALIALLVTPIGAVVWHQRQHEGRVYPGVRLNGADISGKTPEEVFSLAQQQSAYYVSPVIQLKVGERVFDFKPNEFGSTFDPAATTKLAMNIGRSGDWEQQLRERAEVYWNGVDIGPTVRMDSSAAARRISEIAAQVDTAAIDAKLNIDLGAASVTESPSQTGLSLDQTASLQLVEAAIRSRASGVVQLPLGVTQPKVTALNDAATLARKYLSNDLIVMVPQWDAAGVSAQPVEGFRIPRNEMGNYVLLDTGEKDGVPTFDLRFRRESMRGRIEGFRNVISGTTQDARFTFDDATKSLTAIQASRFGRELDVDATLDAIEQAARSDANRTVVLTVKVVKPAVPDTARAADLGVTELITQATTFFKGSSAARLTNVKVAAARFHGVVIPPGEVFSFNKFLGNVSAEEGFAEGLIIVGNRTEKGVGGGVCQVSTTAFQAALRAGFPIVERYPHGYRVSYYERGMGAGYDAAVFTPWADLKFRNDTKSHLLIETYYDPVRVTLTFKFYGTRDDRQVLISPSKISSTVPKSADLYEPDPEGKLGEGQIKQVEYAVDGATIAFSRTVTRNGETVINETITSKYVPWRNVFRFGPNAQLPPGVEIAQPAPQ
jgi:vancomycin resistance protein YoaR